MPDERVYNGEYLIGTIMWAGEWNGRPAIGLSGANMGSIWAYHAGRGWVREIHRSEWDEAYQYIRPVQPESEKVQPEGEKVKKLLAQIAIMSKRDFELRSAMDKWIDAGDEPPEDE